MLQFDRNILQDAEKIKQFWGCPYVCSIDIFPMDFLRLDRNNRDFKFPKEWFDETIEAPFETILLPVPKEYDKVLTVYYGRDYMIPIQSTGNHAYPFYKRQQQFLDDNDIKFPL